MVKNKFDAIIFDMDGTLVDSESALLGIWETTARDAGFDFSRAVMIKTIGTTYDETVRIMREVYPDAPHDEIRVEMSARFKAMRENGQIGLMPGALEALEEVSQLGVPIGLCTSTRGSSATVTLESVGILKYFNATVFGDEVANGKPDPEPYLKVASKLGVSPARCLVAEDSPSGARSALSAGMTVTIIPDIILLPEDVLSRVILLDSINQVASVFSHR